MTQLPVSVPGVAVFDPRPVSQPEASGPYLQSHGPVLICQVTKAAAGIFMTSAFYIYFSIAADTPR